MHLGSRDLTEVYSLKPSYRVKLVFESFSPFKAVVLSRQGRAGHTIITVQVLVTAVTILPQADMQCFCPFLTLLFGTRGHISPVHLTELLSPKPFTSVSIYYSPFEGNKRTNSYKM